MGGVMGKPFSLVRTLLWRVLFSWWMKPIEKPDDVTGLTPTQVRLVQESWKVILLHKRQNGFLIFRILFTDYPMTKRLFKGIDKVDPEQYEKTTSMRAHVTRFINSFDTFMECLEEPDALKTLLYDTGKAHLRHNTKPEHFDDLEVVMMKSLKAVLGQKFTESVEGAWRTAFAFFIVHLKLGVTEALRGREKKDTSVVVTVE
ncbi:cytoglobin-1-like [Branchiostoma lanceolatum]|uniref:cytoglobin-1-like n=1 Tax=Branchiostoma lanceolatum TaxID=7740 RepID=UPI0011332A49